MTPQQLDALGASALRQLARQVRLRGAAVLDPDALRIGLRAYFARAPATFEEEDREGDRTTGLEESLPPALQTETMARVLEAQGRRGEAEVLRAGLREPAAAPPTAQPDEHLRLEVDDHSFRLRWTLDPRRVPAEDEAASPPPAPLQLELWLWRTSGARVTRRIPVSGARGEHREDRTGDEILAVAALGARDGSAPFSPLCRTPLWRAADGSPHGDPSPP